MSESGAASCSQLDAAPLRRSPWKLSGLGVEWTACCVLSYCEVLVTVARAPQSWLAWQLGP